MRCLWVVEARWLGKWRPLEAGHLIAYRTRAAARIRANVLRTTLYPKRVVKYVPAVSECTPELSIPIEAVSE